MLYRLFVFICFRFFAQMLAVLVFLVLVVGNQAYFRGGPRPLLMRIQDAAPVKRSVDAVED
jgi:hypothetical protein